MNHPQRGRIQHRILCPLPGRLRAVRDGQLAKQRERDRQHVFRDRDPADPARVGHHHAGVDDRRKEHASDARRGAVNPLERFRGRELIGPHFRHEGDLRPWNQLDRLRFGRRVEERVLREDLPQVRDMRRGDVPGREGAVDADEDRLRGSHARKSPLRPPRFSTSRISPMTIRLSTALIMS